MQLMNRETCDVENNGKLRIGFVYCMDENFLNFYLDIWDPMKMGCE